MVKFIDRLFHTAIAVALTFLFVFSAGLCGWMYYRGWWVTLYPTGGDISEPLGVPLIVYQISAPHLITASAEAWVGNHTSAQALAYAHDILTVLAAALVFAGLVAIGAWRQVGEKPSERHLRGRRLLTGKASVQAARQPLWRRVVWWWIEPGRNRAEMLAKPGLWIAGKPGIYIHPKVRLRRRTEVEHFLALGKTRSGKTVLTIPVLNQVVEQNALVLIADIKNDYAELVPATTPILGVDRGTYGWDMARDIRTLEHAREFAARIVKVPQDSTNKYFYAAAKNIITAAIAGAMIQNPDKWTIWQLSEILARDKTDIQTLLTDPRIDQILPNVSEYVSGERESADDVLGNFREESQPIHDLARAWRDRGLKAWSVADWLSGQGAPQVVLAGSETLPDLAAIMFSLILPVAAGATLALPDSRQRRVWYFLDELSAFGRLDPVLRLLERGGSKGAAVWLALQDLSQLSKAYGDNDARTIRANLATWLVSEVGEVETQKYLAQAIDERNVIRAAESRSSNDRGGSDSQSESEHKEWVVAPFEFRDLIGADPDRMKVRALLHWKGFVGLLDWPIRSYPTVRKIANWPERPIVQANRKPSRRAAELQPSAPAITQSTQPEPEIEAELSTLDPLTRAREAARKLNNPGGDQ